MKTKNYVLMALLLMLCAIAGSAKKVHTLGDSTMAPYDENATQTRGWGMYFGNFLTNGWTSVNYAKGGRDSRGGYNELWQNAKNNVQAGDYVLIQFAHNDGKYSSVDNLELQAYYTAKGDATNAAAVKSDGRGTTPSTTYKECLKQIVDAVKAKGATPVLVSAVCRCYFGSDNKITRPGRHDLGDKYDAIVNGELKTGQKVAASDHSMDYSYQMQQLANELNVAFIDMTTATKELYESYKTYDKCYAALFDKGGEKDNTHYNLTGALTAARLCAQLMKEKGILADDIVIPTELSITPATVDMGEGYLGKTAMKEATVPGAPASGCTLTWDDSNYTLLWAVCKDGSIYAFTTEPTFTATVSGTYTVRAANEMGGLSAASESVTVSEDMITGIKDIDGLRIDNLQFDAVYDLQGRKIENRKLVNGQLSNGQLSNSKLKRGLYIIDGHKVMVK
jgi:lysophospholipase L1-like esterase